MEAPANGRFHEDEPHREGLYSAGEGEPHGKVSVLKKVRNKAKKIKDTLTKKHGHDDEHGDQNTTTDEEEEEGYDVGDEEKVGAPEVHGAPVYESEAAPNFVEDRQGNRRKDGLGLLNAGAVGEDPGAPKSQGASFVPGSYQTSDTNTSSTGGTEPGVIRAVKEEPAAPKSQSPSKEGLALLNPEPMEEDSGVPKSQGGSFESGSYQTSDTNSPISDGPEPGVIRSFQGMSVSDQPEKDTGSPDQFAPEKTETAHEKPEEKSGEKGGGEQQPKEQSYKDKLYAAADQPEKDTGSPDQFAPEKTETAHEKPEEKSGEKGGGEQQPKEQSYKDKFYAAASAITEKANQVKDAAMSATVGSKDQAKKVEGTGGEGEEKPGQNPGELQNNPSYTGRLSNTASAITGKAVQVKDAFVSATLGSRDRGKKAETVMGPGEQGREISEQRAEGKEGEEQQPKQQSYTGKLSAITNKAVRAKDAVLSSTVGKNAEDQAVTATGEQGKGKKDKGVSMREYLVEKLSPGEEDKALSEVISETVHKRDDKAEKKGTTESSEKAAAASSEGKAQEGMVEKIRGAVTSLLGGSSASSHPPVGQSHVQRGEEMQISSGEGEPRRLQESSN